MKTRMGLEQIPDVQTSQKGAVMNKTKRISSLMLSGALAMTLLTVPASALTYTVEGADVGDFGPITSVTDELKAADNAADYSKNAAYAPPGFGTPESYIPNRAEQLINLKGTDGDTSGVTIGPGSIDPTTQNSGITIVNGFPAVDGGTTTVGTATVTSATTTSVGFTPVTGNSYLSNGTLGTIRIPAIGVNFGIYEGTTSNDMLNGAGHFVGSSIWDGNVCLAAHNRGVVNNFGKINTLSAGDTITLTTAYGTRTYKVFSVQKVSETDTSCLKDSATNMITLVTCVANERTYRYVVQAYQV